MNGQMPQPICPSGPNDGFAAGPRELLRGTYQARSGGSPADPEAIGKLRARYHTDQLSALTARAE